jgi:hypothetical protein
MLGEGDPGTPGSIDARRHFQGEFKTPHARRLDQEEADSVASGARTVANRALKDGSNDSLSLQGGSPYAQAISQREEFNVHGRLGMKFDETARQARARERPAPAVRFGNRQLDALCQRIGSSDPAVS